MRHSYVLLPVVDSFYHQTPLPPPAQLVSSGMAVPMAPLQAVGPGILNSPHPYVSQKLTPQVDHYTKIAHLESCDTASVTQFITISKPTVAHSHSSITKTGKKTLEFNTSYLLL